MTPSDSGYTMLADSLAFGLAQQDRDAHLRSYDQCGAILAWFVCPSLYAGIYRTRLWAWTASEAADVCSVGGGRLISAADDVSPGGAN